MQSTNFRGRRQTVSAFQGSGISSRQPRRGYFEPLEDRRLLALNLTTVGIRAPVLVAFKDPGARLGTTFTAQSTNTSAVTAALISNT